MNTYNHSHQIKKMLTLRNNLKIKQRTERSSQIPEIYMDHTHSLINVIIDLF